MKVSIKSAIIASAALLATVGIANSSIKNNSIAPVDTGGGYSSMPTIEKDVPEIETKTETEEHRIPHGTKTVSDNTLEKGKTKIKTEGQDGIEVVEYLVTYVDGEVKSREIVSTKTVKESVDEVVAEGTYVKPVSTPKTNTGNTTIKCPNGSYRNSAGNLVCRPSSSNAGGATARCRDGSYSYSRSRKGTCSHHGGVAVWL